MTIATLLGIAAAAIALWPAKKKTGGGGVPYLPSVAELSPQPPKRHPSYIEAVANLAAVKARLSATEHLDDEQSEAINTLTLALVAGSDAL